MIEGSYLYTMWFVIQIIYVSVASRENLSKIPEEGYNRFSTPNLLARTPYGKVTKHRKTSHTREPRGQPSLKSAGVCSPYYGPLHLGKTLQCEKIKRRDP